METVAIGVYVTEATGQAAWTGAVAAAGFVPIALLGPLGGAFADRFPRRLLMMSTTLVQTALAALLTILFIVGAPSAPVVTLIVFGSGIASALGFPAFQAMLPDLVPEEDLAERDRDVVGAVQPRPRRRPGDRRRRHRPRRLRVGAGHQRGELPRRRVRPDARSGSRRRHRRPKARPCGARWRSVRASCAPIAGLRVSVGAMCINTLLAAPFIALVPAMAEKVFDAGPRGTSILVTAQGIGAVSMGFALGALTTRFGIRRVVERDARAPAARARGVRVRTRAAVLRAGAALRRRVLPRRAVELLHDLAAARARQPARAGAGREQHHPRLALSAWARSCKGRSRTRSGCARRLPARRC